MYNFTYTYLLFFCCCCFCWSFVFRLLGWRLVLLVLLLFGEFPKSDTNQTITKLFLVSKFNPKHTLKASRGWHTLSYWMALSLCNCVRWGVYCPFCCWFTWIFFLTFRNFIAPHLSKCNHLLFSFLQIPSFLVSTKIHYAQLFFPQETFQQFIQTFFTSFSHLVTLHFSNFGFSLSFTLLLFALNFASLLQSGSLLLVLPRRVEFSAPNSGFALIRDFAAT